MATDVVKDNEILQQYDEKNRLYQSFANEVEHLIRSILESGKINCNAITSRLKSRDSVEEKIKRKQGKYSTISDITDIVGVRIITYYSDDVDKIAQIIENEFDVDRENSIDKRESLEPDRFGYCSVHYVVKMSPMRLALCEYQAFKDIKCEIQIRSVLQHAWAEIEHDIGYKSPVTIPKEMRRSFSRIAGLLEIADKEFGQIRQDLLKYKVDAQTQVNDESFLDRELDGVILEVIIHSKPEIQDINQHIAKLIGCPLESFESDELIKYTINDLNWFGIKTVRQTYDMISKYTNLAKDIASEILNKRCEDHERKAEQTIAFLYLCYAVLLSKCQNEEEVCQYFDHGNIESPDKRKEAAKEFMKLKKLL